MGKVLKDLIDHLNFVGMDLNFVYILDLLETFSYFQAYGFRYSQCLIRIRRLQEKFPFHQAAQMQRQCHILGF